MLFSPPLPRGVTDSQVGCHKGGAVLVHVQVEEYGTLTYSSVATSDAQVSVLDIAVVVKDCNLPPSLLRSSRGPLQSQVKIYLVHQPIRCRIWHNISKDRVQPKMSPSISFSGMYQKLFILHRNRTNLWYISHMYFSTSFFFLYVGSKTGLSTIILILDTHLFSNFVTMSFDYDFFVFRCRIWNNVYIFGIYLFSLPKHTALVTLITLQLCLYQNHNPTKLNYHYPNTETNERWSNIGGQTIVVRYILTQI